MVFPHPDWVDRANDDASDFHPVSKKNRSDSWSFEVRTDDPERELSLSWAGLNEVLDSSWLVDEETGKIIEVADVTNHTFVIGSTARSFTWHYSGKEDKKRK